MLLNVFEVPKILGKFSIACYTLTLHCIVYQSHSVFNASEFGLWQPITNIIINLYIIGIRRGFIISSSSRREWLSYLPILIYLMWSHALIQ